MCLIVHKPADVTFDEELLRDFYSRNRDGFGVMYAEKGKLHFHKQIGRVEDWLTFFEKYKDREAVFHLRMQTHGDIDLENTHPYPVFGFKGDEDSPHPLLLVHNGILMEGNTDDQTKSDTWHYIRKHLRPMLQGNVDYAFTPSFDKIVGRHIGSSNRFVLMDTLGRVQIVNKDTGVMFQGAWLSNEYAWSASKYLRPRTYNTNGRAVTSWDTNPYNNAAKYDDSRYDHYWRQKDRDDPKWWKETRADGSAYWTDGKSQYDESPPKSKRQQKREAKAARLAEAKARAKASDAKVLSLPGTGTTAARASSMALTTRTTDEVGESFRAKRETIKHEWVDDVLELRSQLDVIYPDAPTKDSELQQLLETVGATKAYFLMELLMDGRIRPSLWDFTVRSVAAAEAFAKMPYESWDKVPKGTYSNGRAFSSDDHATEEEGVIQ